MSARERHIPDFRHADPTDRPSRPAHLRDHLAPRRGQDHADREAAAAGRRDPPRRRGQGARAGAARALGLDEDRAAARHLGDQLGDDLRARRHHLQPARHAGPRGLLGGHLPHADRGRFGGHGDRRGQGHRAADAQAVRGLPAALGADHHLRQQGRPRGPRRRSSCSTRSPTCSRSTSARRAGRSGWAGMFEGVLDFASGAISRPEGPSKEFLGKRDDRRRRCPAESRATKSSWRAAAIPSSTSRPIATAT